MVHPSSSPQPHRFVTFAAQGSMVVEKYVEHATSGMGCVPANRVVPAPARPTETMDTGRVTPAIGAKLSTTSTTPTTNRTARPLRVISELELEAAQEFPIRFDALDTPPCPIARRWLASTAVALVVGFALSLHYLLVGWFPPFGYAGSSVTDHLLAKLGHAVGLCLQAFFLAGWSPKRCTAGWQAYYAVWMLLATFGVMALIELCIGQQEGTSYTRLHWVLLPITQQSCLLCLPLAQALALIGHAPDIDWRYPWKWSLRRYHKRCPYSELQYFLVSFLAATLLTTASIFDGYIAIQPKWRDMAWLQLWARPAMAFVCRRLLSALFLYGIALSKLPEVKVWGLYSITLGVSGIMARLVAACLNWNDFAIILAGDWFTFILRTVVACTAISPSVEHLTGGSRLLKRVPLALVTKLCSPGTTDKVQYKAFQYVPPNPRPSEVHISPTAETRAPWSTGAPIRLQPTAVSCHPTAAGWMPTAVNCSSTSISVGALVDTQITRV